MLPPALTLPTSDLAGFTPGLPPWLTAGAAAVDRLVCRQARCGSCKKRGLDFHPFFREHPGPRSYVALMACPVCNSCEQL